MLRIKMCVLLKATFIALICITILGILNLNEKENTIRNAPKEILDFDHQWCRLQRLRLDWKQYLGQCINEMQWKQRYHHNSSRRTSPLNSYISKWERSPVGHFSRFWIQSVNIQGQLKTRGGDSWRVYVKQGPASLAPVVIDHQNGLYEVLMLITEPGTYTAEITLEFTLCDGFRDPPDDWFRIGNVQGKFQKDGVLGYIGNDYINMRLGGRNKTRFDIAQQMNPTSDQGFFKYCKNYSKGTCQSYDGGIPLCKYVQNCSYLWDGFGQWIEGRWRPFFIGTYKTIEKVPVATPVSQSGILWIIGDSINTRFHTLIRNRPLCTTMFKECKSTYNWLYEVKNVEEAKTTFDNNDFNSTILLNQYKDILSNPKLMSEKSAFILNLGVHYTISLNFKIFQKLIDDILRVLTLLEELSKNEEIVSWKPSVIWKTSTAVQREKISLKYLHMACIRFQTSQRVQLFNLYTTSVMCNAEIPILDVYHLSASYMSGTLDGIHYRWGVFDAAVDVLESFFQVKLKRL